MTLSGLSKRLVDDQLLDESSAKSAYLQASKLKIPFVTHLVKNKLVSAANIARVAADEFGTPLFDISSLDRESIPKELINEPLVLKHHALPLFKRGTRLFVAVADPTNLIALDEICFNTGLIVDAVLVEEDKLTRAIDDFLAANDSSLGDLDEDELANLETSVATDNKNDQDDGSDADDAPVVKFVNKMLLTAIKGGASDLHFEPYERTFRVRFRTDGILHQVSTPPINLAPRIASRLKIMSGMDIAEKRVPQDGRIKLKISKTKSIDFRVNTLPTLWGEKVVLRILDPTSAQMGIDALGYEPDQKEMYLNALSQPQGMILVTGPTGSGKTVSLYTGINILNTPELNISTAEDPVEINLEGINQVNVSNKRGMDFANALRAFLRQDPDIIMVGEIRDIETANIAIKAAQTGHLVMSTLHTNSAAETLTRMINMGVPAFNLATSIKLIIAQRLGRRLCGNCKIKADIPHKTLLDEGFTEEQLKDAAIFSPNIKGCDSCNKGYKGRVGIYEVVKITPELSRIIMEEGNSLQISEQARKEGFDDLRASGLLKILQGVTSLEEINRVTQE